MYATIKLVTLQAQISGKPEKDAEAHLLRTNDWIDTYRLLEDDSGILFDTSRKGKIMVPVLKTNKHSLDKITKLI